jgi:uncharacterized protein (TIGR02391 family)
MNHTKVSLTMNVEFETLLHPRVLSHCKQLYIDGHYKHAALEAMTQVELALKEKSGVKNKFGVNLVTSILGKNKGIKLRVLFGDEWQEKAEKLFSGAFSYYRNYAAHDGSKIDNRTCLRVMILASELLDLIGASVLSFADVGGISGLVQTCVFPDKKSIYELLRFIDGQTFPDETVDGFFEDLSLKGFSDTQVQALIEVGLVEYVAKPYVPSELDLDDYSVLPPDSISWFELTKLGKEIVTNLEQNAK